MSKFEAEALQGIVEGGFSTETKKQLNALLTDPGKDTSNIDIVHQLSHIAAKTLEEPLEVEWNEDFASAVTLPSTTKIGLRAQDEYDQRFGKLLSEGLQRALPSQEWLTRVECEFYRSAWVHGCRYSCQANVGAKHLRSAVFAVANRRGDMEEYWANILVFAIVKGITKEGKVYKLPMFVARCFREIQRPAAARNCPLPCFDPKPRSQVDEAWPCVRLLNRAILLPCPTDPDREDGPAKAFQGLRILSTRSGSLS